MILKGLLYYLSLGILWLGFIEFINRYTDSVNSFSKSFILVNIALWPVGLIVFIISFCWNFFNGSND